MFPWLTRQGNDLREHPVVCRKTVTLTGARMYVLAVIEHRTRRIRVLGFGGDRAGVELIICSD